MKKFVAVLILGLLLILVCLSSPVSYFYVYFKEPMNSQEFLDYLSDNGINPRESKVYVLHSTLSQPEGINDLDGAAKGQKVIGDAVFNTRLYALKAVFDSRVKWRRLAGPRHPYD